MTSEDAASRLEHALARDSAGRYVFLCRKAFVIVKLHGERSRLRFGVRDKVVFRADATCLIVEGFGNGAVKHRFNWDQIECIAAGEPEIDNGPLFQG